MIGEFAALAAAFLWTSTSIFFTLSGRSVGSDVVNRIRLLIGLVFLTTLHFITQGKFLPINADLSHWYWFGLSGFIGLILGDSALFQAFVLIGPHLSMLIMTMVPIISIIFAWFFLAETLSVINIIGIVLTIGGIVLVVLTKGNSTIADKKRFIIGILCAIGGAVGQATGLIIAKKGLYNNFTGLSATVIRVFTATLIIWLITLIRRKVKITVQKVIRKKTYLAIVAGAFCGPFLGIWMSMNAIKWTRIGIVSTLMALPPIFLLPISHFIFKEKIKLQSIIGTIIAVLGIAVIFLL